MVNQLNKARLLQSGIASVKDKANFVEMLADQIA